MIDRNGIPIIGQHSRHYMKRYDFVRSVRKSHAYNRWRKECLQNKCSICGSTANLTVHHKTPLSVLLEQYNINSIGKMLQYKNILFNGNGETVCDSCHIKIHEGGNYEL